MCGISGIINKNDQTVDPAELAVMNDLIKHRGPDGEGTYFGHNFALGHRRLSIIDLSDQAAQPMSWDDELIISFNGEIYNYLEVKSRLRKDGYIFKTSSDTEVLLAAYNHWGFDCVSKFNGMWSFVIYDKKQNLLFCSRDRFGIKPFYYSSSSEFFLLGSEIKQILPFLKKQTVNQSILLDYLLIGFEEHTNQTFFENVQKLPAGHNLIYDLEKHTFDIRGYYTIKFDESTHQMGEEESIRDYALEFKKAVELRLRSDVKVGTCLSGGLDSSSVAALASNLYRKESDDKFIAIHAKSSEIATDESKYAQLVSDKADLDLKVLQPSEQDFKNALDKVIYAQEEPFGSPSVFMQYFVMNKALSEGCKVMLDGQGGDETLLGYEKYYPAYIKSLKGFNKISGFLGASKNSKLSRKQLISYFFYFTRYKLRLKRLKSRHNYFKQDILDSFESEALKEMSDSYLDILKLQKFEIAHTQLPHLLRYEDKNSMANSIETRLPFIDYHVLECALSIKNEYKIKDGWTKYILRKVVEDELPEEVVWRKHKLGFNAPEKDWLKSIEEEMKISVNASEILERLIDKDKLIWNRLDNRTKWRLFNVARWEQLYHVGKN